MLVKFMDKILCLIDVQLDVVVRDSDFSVKESEIGGVPNHGVEDDFLIFDILAPWVKGCGALWSFWEIRPSTESTGFLEEGAYVLGFKEAFTIQLVVDAVDVG